MSIKATPLQSAIKRLERSKTPRTRNNALRAVKAAARSIVTACQKQYPNLRDDGTAIVRRKAKGARCPVCRVPIYSLGALIQHMARKHRDHMRSHANTINNEARWLCACGKSGNHRAMIGHLARSGDLEVHFAKAVMKQATQPMPFTIFKKGAINATKRVRRR